MATMQELGPFFLSQSNEITFNFTGLTPAGMYLVSSSVVATVYEGVDATPQLIVDGSPNINGLLVIQLITAKNVSVIYMITCTAVTNTGLQLITTGFLTVIPEADSENPYVAQFVTGPAGATDGHIVLFDGPTGRFLKDSGKFESQLNVNTAVTLNPGSRINGTLFDGSQDITINAQLGTLVNVKNYGAVGNGIHDDTTAIQTALSSGNNLWFPRGTYLVSSELSADSNITIWGECQQFTTIKRTPTHNGHTLVLGNPNTAGAFRVQNINFYRENTFNGGYVYAAPNDWNSGTTYGAGALYQVAYGGFSYTSLQAGNTNHIPSSSPTWWQVGPPISTSLDNLLTNRAHLFLIRGQQAFVDGCYFFHMPFNIYMEDGVLLTITDTLMVGSIWDQLTVAMQEGIANIHCLPDSGVATTLLTVDNVYMTGGYSSAPRNVVIGTVTANYAEDVGCKYGIWIKGCEGVNVTNCYIGGQNDSGIFINPTASSVCSDIKIANNFFDGTRISNISIDAADNASSATMCSIANNTFHGGDVTLRALYVGDAHGTAALYGCTITGNVMQGHENSSIYLRGAVACEISNNIVSAYNVRGGNTDDPVGAAGICVEGTLSKHIHLSNNAWGGGESNYSATNKCQYGVFFVGDSGTSSVSNEHNNGLGLPGPAVCRFLSGIALGGLSVQTSATYTVLDSDQYLIANFAGTVTYTLPAPVENFGRSLTFKTITANTVVSAASNVRPLASGAAGTAILAATDGKFARLVSDGTDWQIMEAN